jgi:hypothetical protein
METPLKRNDMTTISDPDISDSDFSIGSKTPKPRDGNCSIASELPLQEAKGSSKATFMTLPVKIRLSIYNILLVKYSYNYERLGLECARGGGPKLFEYGDTRMELGIMRTCRQIYQEANSIFYTQNRFYFSNLHDLLQFVHDIGPANLKLVQEVHFQNDTYQFYSLWQLFDELVDDANVSAGRVNIQVLYGKWYTIVEYNGEARGPTTEQHFARALKHVNGMAGELNKSNRRLFGMISFSGRTFCLAF